MPIKVTIHRINGEAASMDAIDARQAVKNHPAEWAYEPFSAEDRRKAQNDQLVVPYSKPDAYTAGHYAQQPPSTVAPEN